MFTIRSRTGSTKNRWKIILIILAVVSILLLLYFLLLQPIVTRLFLLRSSIYEGPEYYNDGSYLKFDAGKRLEKALRSTGYAEKGTVVDFYYINTWWRDNPFYGGKMLDTYAIDIQMNAQDYAEVREAVINNYKYSEDEVDYVLYSTSYDTGDDEDVLFVALCDREQIVRLVLLTDIDSKPLSYMDCIRMHSTLGWVAPTSD